MVIVNQSLKARQTQQDSSPETLERLPSKQALRGFQQADNLKPSAHSTIRLVNPVSPRSDTLEAREGVFDFFYTGDHYNGVALALSLFENSAAEDLTLEAITNPRTKDVLCEIFEDTQYTTAQKIDILKLYHVFCIATFEELLKTYDQSDHDSQSKDAHERIHNDKIRCLFSISESKQAIQQINEITGSDDISEDSPVEIDYSTYIDQISNQIQSLSPSSQSSFQRLQLHILSKLVFYFSIEEKKVEGKAYTEFENHVRELTKRFTEPGPLNQVRAILDTFSPNKDSEALYKRICIRLNILEQKLKELPKENLEQYSESKLTKTRQEDALLDAIFDAYNGLHHEFQALQNIDANFYVHMSNVARITFIQTPNEQIDHDSSKIKGAPIGTFLERIRKCFSDQYRIPIYEQSELLDLLKNADPQHKDKLENIIDEFIEASGNQWNETNWRIINFDFLQEVKAKIAENDLFSAEPSKDKSKAKKPPKKNKNNKHNRNKAKEANQASAAEKTKTKSKSPEPAVTQITVSEDDQTTFETVSRKKTRSKKPTYLPIFNGEKVRVAIKDYAQRRSFLADAVHPCTFKPDENWSAEELICAYHMKHISPDDRKDVPVEAYALCSKLLCLNLESRLTHTNSHFQGHYQFDNQSFDNDDNLVRYFLPDQQAKLVARVDQTSGKVRTITLCKPSYDQTNEKFSKDEISTLLNQLLTEQSLANNPSLQAYVTHHAELIDHIRSELS